MSDEARKIDTPAFDRAYYAQTTGIDDLRRFSMAWWSVRYYAQLVRRLLSGIAAPRCLEVGCAHGFILARLEPVCETWGVDVSAYAVGRAQQIAPRSRVVEGDVCGAIDPVVPRAAFDVVLARYVLEHVPDPALALRTLAAFLKPGGRLLYAVPNTTSPGRRLKREDWFALRDPTHISLLAPDEWRAATRAAGFVIEREFSDGLWDVPYVRGVPRLLQLVTLAAPAAVNVLLARPLLPLSWGEDLIVIARKPL